MNATIEKHAHPTLPAGGREHRGRSVKWVVCIIRAEKLSAVTDQLHKLNLVGGMTVSDLRGAGHESSATAVFRGSQFKVAYLPKVKIEIAVEAADVEQVEMVISESARTGDVGDGRIFVFPVSDIMRVRTGERGTSAL